jgi:hypothetical protein
MITVQLTETDYIAGQRLHSRWSKRYWIIALSLTFPVLCIGIAAWLGAFSDEFENLGLLIVAWVIGTWVGGLGARALFAPGKWRRLFASHKLLQSVITYSWDADHFTAKSEYGNSSVPWSKFLKFKEDHLSVLLYISRLQFYCIPSHAFPDQQTRNGFLGLLRQRVGA